MPVFTVCYRHPHHIPEGGRYEVTSVSAEAAGNEALDTLPDDLSPDEEPELQDLETIRDDLEITVFAGSLSSKPDGPPAWELR